MYYLLNNKYQFEYLSDEKILILSEDENHLVQNSNYVNLLRLLADGKCSKVEMLSRLSKVLNSEKLNKILNELEIRKLIVQESEISDQYLKIKSLCNESFSILSFTDLDLDPLFLALNEFNFNIVEDGSFCIVIVDDYLDNRLMKFCEESRNLNRTWMLMKPKGKCLWIGPIFNNFDSADFDWNLIATRIKENSHSKVDLLGFNSDKLALKTLPQISTNISIACNIVANELARWFLTKNSALTDSILTYDSTTLTTKFHQISPHLRSLEQGAAKPLPMIALKSSEKLFFDELGERACTPDTTYEKIKMFNSPITGFIGKSGYKLEDGFHVFYGQRSLKFPDKENSITSPRIPDIAVGKHRNRTYAEVGFISEALERYTCTDLGLHQKYFANYKELGDEAIHPELLLNFSNYQYLHRLELNASSTPFQWISQPFDESSPISWLLLNTIDSQTKRYIPASFCYTNYFINSETQVCPGDSNGCATGNTFEEAVYYSILEIIERDAMAIWWYNRLKRPSVELATFSSLLIEETINQIAKRGRILRVIDITTEIRIPTFVVASWESDGSRIILGSGAHLDAQIAIQRAISEHNQILTRSKIPKSINLSTILPTERGLIEWILNENVLSHPYIFEETSQKNRDDYVKIASKDFYTDILTCTKELRKSRLDVFWLPLVPRDFPLKTVKVIIPKMRHFWKRLGKGRLYQVPVLLGDFTDPLEEEALNPIAYFV